ncbi:MAG: AAA family ATPase [Anaerolineales bacterium]
MRCPDCQTDNPEGARFCLNCGRIMKRRCTNCQADLQAEARFCMYCGQPVRTQTAEDDEYHHRLTAATPAPLVEKVRAASALSGERRLVTVLHLDVVGSTAITEEIGEEAWAGVMTAAYDRFAQIIYFYEGTIARLLGDALVAFFGAPVMHEDDPIRAAKAALELIDIAKDYHNKVKRGQGIDFSVRVCLNTGPVVIGPVGSDLRYDFTPIGGVVNLAARIKFAAQPMAVLVSESTLSFISPVFEYTDLGLIEVADRLKPVRVYQLLGTRAKPERMRGLSGFESPMVGREAELSVLMKLCSAVRAGLGRAVLISGEPGMGKSRLYREWKIAVKAEDTMPLSIWVEGRCLSYGGGLAYHLVIDVLYALLGVKRSAAEPEIHQALYAILRDYYGEQEISLGSQEIYPYLAHLLSLKLDDEALSKVDSLDPQTLQNRYLSAFRSLLLKISSRQPVIVVFEDLHWADPSSVDLLIKILPVVSAEPILMCLISRVELDTPGWKLVSAAREILGESITEISLKALSEIDSRQMVENLLEVEALPEETRDLILEKSEGNPFFVEEVIRMLIDRGAIRRVNGNWVAGGNIDQVEIPDNLQGLLLARIDRLPEDVKHTLRVASVIGRQFPVKVLEQVLGENVQ